MMESGNTERHAIVSHEDWLEARKRLLIEEKAYARAGERLAQTRRDLPWERVEKSYSFEGPDGEVTLSDVFAGKSQLIVYHFMFDEDEDAGCKHCSFWADNFNGITPHLRANDIAFVAVSRVPFTKIAAYKKRMGWDFSWLSSFGSDFNRDFGVTFTQEEIETGRAFFNYQMQESPDTEREGISVFHAGADRTLFHTYSTYARGIDIVNGAYHFIDMTPKGRDEGDSPQRWVRRHDEYPD